MSRFTTYHGDKAVIKDRAQLSEAMDKLAKCEDAEAAGKLAILPCALGDKLYWIADETVDGKPGLCIRRTEPVIGIAVQKDGFYVCTDPDGGYDRLGCEWAMLTEEEAERMLERMNGGQQ